MRRLAALFLSVAGVLAISGSGLAAVGSPGAAGGVELPETGALFGTFLRLDDHNGLERRQAMLDFEALVGRQMAVDRQYYRWDEAFPTDDDYWSRDQGRILYLSWNSVGNDLVCRLWADIAAGLYDADIDARAAAVIDFEAPLFFAFHHEPMTGQPGDNDCGTPEEYVDAWRHVRARFIANGVTNVTWAVTFTALSYEPGNVAELYYPGDEYTDVIAADGYNWFGCDFHPGPWREFDEVFRAFYEFGEQHGKPLFIAEYGTGEDPLVEGRKGRWFTNAAQTLKEWPLIKGVSYYNVGTVCARYADSSPSSLDAFQANGADPYLNPPVPVTNVSVADFSFTPRRAIPTRGAEVRWTFSGPSDHTVTDASGMGLFDSGVASTGGTFSHYFIGAGSYRYQCDIHPAQMTGQVRVPLSVAPRNGDIDTTFQVTWAANHAPAGYVFDVQIKRPVGGWQNWLLGQTLETATFVPDAGTGTYQFRARYHVDGGAASGWSVPVGIIVS